MALGNGSSFNDNSDLIFLSPRSQDKDGKKVKPHFSVGRKGADGKIESVESDNSQVSGDLTRLEIKERTFNGSTTKKVYLYLKDRKAADGKGETYLVDLTFRNSTRGLFNRMFSLETPNNLTIGVFENARGYETFYLRQDEQKVQWKFEIESLPEPTLKRVNGKNVNDYEEVDAFFEKELQALAVRLGVAPKAKAASAAADSATHSDETVPAARVEKAASSAATQPKDDLPF